MRVSPAKMAISVKVALAMRPVGSLTTLVSGTTVMLPSSPGPAINSLPLPPGQ
ncbi:MAG: hypothetical protein R2911_04910 [Caldilineaceae bacterium]